MYTNSPNNIDKKTEQVTGVHTQQQGDALEQI